MTPSFTPLHMFLVSPVRESSRPPYTHEKVGSHEVREPRWEKGHEETLVYDAIVVVLGLYEDADE